MNKKKITAYITVLVLISTMFLNINFKVYALSSWTDYAANELSDGEGTNINPYIISSMGELAFISNMVNNGDKKYIEAYYILDNDLDASGHEWIPIGNTSKKFKGTFDGNGNEISNIKVSSTSNSVGFFGYVYGEGTVRNLGIVDSNISGKGDVGGIAGYNSGSILNCYTNTQINASSTNCGGIVGRNAGSIRNCYFTGVITSSDNNIGGIAGINSSVINYCYSSGTIESSGKNTGGVIGNNSGNLINSYSDGQIYGEGQYIGGVAGLSSGNIMNCFNTGDIDNNGEYVGGITGKNSGVILNSYNTYLVSARNEYVGGIAGHNSRGSISECYYINNSSLQDVGVNNGGKISSTQMTEISMKSNKFVNTLNSNRESHDDWAQWQQSEDKNSLYPYFSLSPSSSFTTIDGEEYQTGDATPSSSDGKTSVVRYMADVSKWFTEGNGTHRYEVVSEDAYGTIDLVTSTGELTYTPTSKDAGKTITIILTAHDGYNYSIGNVTISITVNDVPKNQSGVRNSKINISKINFDKEAGNPENSNIEVTMTLYGNLFLQIKNREQLLTVGEDYTIIKGTTSSTQKVIIKKQYLESLDPSDVVLTFIFSEGANPELKITLKDSSLETYRVVFKNGSTTYHIEDDITRSAKIKLPENPVKTNYTFGGWFTKTGGNGTQFTAKTLIKEDYTLYAYWKSKGSSSSSSSKTKTYTIKSTAAKGGSISPSGSVKVEEGDNQRFTIKPDQGYMVSDVLVNNSSIGKVKTYTFKDVEKAQTISVKFAVDDGSGEDSNLHRGYMSGYSDGTFRPDEQITRKEAATMFSRISDEFNDVEIYKNKFNDVDDDAWYQKYVGYATFSGIVTGYEDGTFKPDEKITRAEFTVMATRYLGVKASKSGKSKFNDCNGHWADTYIFALNKKEIIGGYSDNTFRPNNSITRAEATRIMNCLLDREPSKSSKLSLDFNDVSKDHWAYYEILEATTTHYENELH